MKVVRTLVWIDRTLKWGERTIQEHVAIPLAVYVTYFAVVAVVSRIVSGEPH